jgi:hypothetical protein
MYGVTRLDATLAALNEHRVPQLILVAAFAHHKTANPE